MLTPAQVWLVVEPVEALLADLVMTSEATLAKGHD